ncbi:MAG: beta-propeller fold lactonase family protein [Armatimonadetes bacterium]|nr:beta-propeller fold lactonase family protein [Armatimonadota bacterium]
MVCTTRWPLFAALVLASGCSAPDRIGPQPDGGHKVATGQYLHPAGKQVHIAARPVDMALSSDGAIAFVRENRGVTIVDVGSVRVLQELEIKGGASYTGIEVSPDGSFWTTTAASDLVHVTRSAEGRWAVAETLTLPKPIDKGEAYPCGFAISPDGKSAVVCLSRNNAIGIVDLASGVTVQIPSDICPYSVTVDWERSMAYVSCWGGPPPDSSARRAPSSGTQVAVDARGIAKGGTVVLIDLNLKRRVHRVPAGLQPSDLLIAPKGQRLYVANANSDQVSVIDLAKWRVSQTLVTHTEPGQLFGSAPGALALSPDEKRLFVTLGGNNAVAVFDVSGPAKILGLIPVGWYPGSLALSGQTLCVANVKGVGSRSGPREGGGHSVYDFKGSVSLIPLPTPDALKAMTQRAKADAQFKEALMALERGRSKGAARPVPARLGEPSSIEHVVYIIKENRTYDQVFGDLEPGDGDPRLCTFPRKITPNHHALAEQFVLLDNYYCNGVNSADGHAWAVEGNASAHLERSFGGWTRSYPFGDDPLSYTTTGFIWDNVLKHGLTFRNYGEFVYSDPKPDKTFKQVYDDYTKGTNKVRIEHKIGVERAKLYANPRFPGWGMKIPDVLRAKVFLDDLKAFERKGQFPNFVIIYLPQDHTSGSEEGMPTPRAHMADNDLALGRIVEGLSKSKFWKKMAIFVNEDDPQNGFDHIDGHRSLCLVLSPYSRNRGVVSQFYNQTSVLHTMERILGIPPMNQMDAMAPVMSACFGARADLRPYRCLPSNVPLDELNPKKSALKGEAKYWAEQSSKLDFSRPDAGNDDLRNRILWYATMGAKPYPSEWAGAHGRGLARKGLKLAASNLRDSDD